MPGFMVIAANDQIFLAVNDMAPEIMIRFLQIIDQGIRIMIVF